MSAIISVNNVGKEYRLGTITTGTLKDDLAAWFSKTKRPERKGQERVWALRDVSFDVEPGQALGIIGKNGAGKSTLLKILSRVTTPTTGIIRARGRIASLLEVGTGFHPELTGRENIFLNGAILGMTKAEIRRKMDEIIAFSGIEKYVDTPVKRYSSGMYVRLAFAVAAHLESEILIMDEVLAVGDAEFQRKCLGKMNDVARNEGRTVLFVSHNMAAVSQLCQNAVMLSKGQMHMQGSAEEVVNEYLAYNAAQASTDGMSEGTLIQDIRFAGLREQREGNVRGFYVDLEIDVLPLEKGTSLDLFIKHRETTIATASSGYHSDLLLEQGRFQTVRLTLGPVNFNLGSYQIDLELNLTRVRTLERYPNALTFSIDKQVVHNFYHSQLDAGATYGYLVPEQQWTSKVRDTVRI